MPDNSAQLWCAKHYGQPVLVFGRCWKDELPRLGIITGQAEQGGFVQVHIFNLPRQDVHEVGMAAVEAYPFVQMLEYGQMPTANACQYWAYPLIRPQPISLQSPPTIKNKVGRPRKLPQPQV